MKLADITNAALKIKILGARGSVPCAGKDFSLYGGATSCYRIRADNEEIYLDAGSGVSGIRPEPETNLTLLLTHMHLDHLIGLPFFPGLAQKNRRIDLYAVEREGLTLPQTLDRLISPPFWPVKIGDYPAEIIFHPLPPEPEKFSVGDVEISRTEGVHPGGSTLFRLTRHGKSIVYATDFEPLSPDDSERLADFAKDCNLLLYDAQYTADEYEKYRGYGHSTPEAGIKTAQAARAERLVFVHHAPWRRDKELLETEEKFSRICGNCSFAKIGEEITI